MIIKTLVENLAISNDYKAEHGLSLYIETTSHKLLFDLGKSDLFLDNAKKLNVDVTEIDTVIISHGHYDHGGGLEAFLEVNTRAKIYLHKKAFDKHYSLRENGDKVFIGLNEKIKDNHRLIFVEDYFKIDSELELFSNVNGDKFCSFLNRNLLMECEDEIIEDTFDHEQSLIITENRKMVLIAGCAHKGIVNIVNQATSNIEKNIDYVIGGFHLYNHNIKMNELPELVKQIGRKLMETGAKCYTCHCTGDKPFEYLREIMQDNIQYLATGAVVEI